MILHFSFCRHSNSCFSICIHPTIQAMRRKLLSCIALIVLCMCGLVVGDTIAQRKAAVRQPAVAKPVRLPELPVQVHIALAGKDASSGRHPAMAVSWTTQDPTNSSVVEFGTTSGALDQHAVGTQVTYGFSFHHHVVLPTLPPDTLIYYRCGDAAVAMSAEFVFRTSPSSLTQPFKAVIYGDMDMSNSAATLARLELVESDISLFWHLGDIGLADDDYRHSLLHDNYEKRWNDYLSYMQNITAYVPYMVLPGNHEAVCKNPLCLLDGTEKKVHNFTAYRNRFRMPAPESGAPTNMWYSFNYGMVHFVSISTETDFPDAKEGPGTLYDCGPFGDQLTWLKEDLKQANLDRDKRPWIILGAHRPFYISIDQFGGKPDGYSKTLQSTFEELFHEYNVDLFFAGHFHSYERQWPTYQNNPQKTLKNPTACATVVIGSPGQEEGFSPLVPCEWSAYQDWEHHGFGRLTVYNSTALLWEFVRSEDGKVYDSMLLEKEH